MIISTPPAAEQAVSPPTSVPITAPRAEDYLAQAKSIGAEFETRRQEVVAKVNKYQPYAYAGGVGGFGLGALFGWLGADIALMDALFLGAVILGLGLYAVQSPARAFRKAIKKEVYPLYVRSLGPKFSYRQADIPPLAFLRRSGLIPHHDEHHFEDFISGEWEGVPFSLVEAKLVDIQGSGKRRRRVTVFDGLFVKFDIPKPVTGRTIIRRDMGAIGNWFGDKFSRLERVSLEDPNFEREFEVYGEDQIEARTLLTTSFMERLRQLAIDIGEGKLQAAFYEGHFMAMVPCRRNRFEPSKKLAEGSIEQDLERFSQDLHDILQIAERLKLGNDSGL